LITTRSHISLCIVAGFVAAALLLAGCKKKEEPARLNASQIHAITREFVAALKSASPKDVEVRNRFSGEQEPASVDNVDVKISAESHSAFQSTVAQLLRALTTVATRHKLALDGPLESREGLLYAFRRSGVVTHQIHFHEEVATASREHREPPQAEGARLAIILDDLGNDRAAAEAIFALGYPLTISVLPNHPHSVDIAEEAHSRGLEVMLHLPMQAMGKEKAEAQELRPGMSSEDVSALVDRLLQAVPDAVGVNNHQGSQSTADAKLMDELMPVLGQHKLFYVDSRTTAATVAYDTAQRFGLPSGFRNVPFLDDVAEVSAVRNQLRLALRGAREKGAAIAIGHPHPATLQALSEVLPQAKSQGVALVFASDLVH
jgi:hypothetical protein